jgi:hypothetical protein
MRHLVEQLNAFNLADLLVSLFGAKVDYHALLRPRFGGSYLVGGGLPRSYDFPGDHAWIRYRDPAVELHAGATSRTSPFSMSPASKASLAILPMTGQFL